MTVVVRFRVRLQAILLGCLVAAGRVALAPPQFAPPLREPLRALLADGGEEARRGTYLFYRQKYRDKHKRDVELHGSVYGVLRDVRVNGCEVEARVEIDDLYSGTIEGAPTGNMQDKTEYAIRFRLTREIAAALDVMDGRPRQLGRAMHTECEQNAACSFTWLRVRSAQSSLHEQIVLNNSITFDGLAKEILAPVSSREAANGLIRDLQRLAAAGCE
ncbi:MAG TPA: hypothetical protein VGL22_06995 [Terracidiphilus sp.]